MLCECVCLCMPCELRAVLRVGVPGMVYSKVTHNTGTMTHSNKVLRKGSFSFTGCLYNEINKVQDLHT